VTINRRRKIHTEDALPSLDAFRFIPEENGRFKSPAKQRKQNDDASEERSLPPLEPGEDTHCVPRVLILGSAPSADSLAMQQYYAHRMNHFWPVVARIFSLESSEQAFASLAYHERVAALVSAGVVVWDMCKLFVRPGSSDNVLKCTEHNEVEELLEKYPSIEIVGLNGQTAYKLFQQHVVKPGRLPRPVRFVCLTSTSPQNAVKNAVQVKAEMWRCALGLDKASEQHPARPYCST
jgi:double-stranded uracil-DNA glycosylase